LQFRADGGAWSSDPPRVLTASTHLQARDEAGNVGELEFHGRTTTPPSGNGCNCELGGNGGGSGWWALLLIPALIFRRRFWLLLLVAGCNHSAPALTKGD